MRQDLDRNQTNAWVLLLAIVLLLFRADAAAARSLFVILGDCYVGQTVGTGDSCAYPDTSLEFTVNENGDSTFLSFTSGSRISVINTTINGVTYNFAASKLGDGAWLIDMVGVQQLLTATPTSTPTSTVTTSALLTVTPTLAATGFPLAVPFMSARASEDGVELSWDAVAGAVRYELWSWWSRETGWQRLDDGGLTAASFRHENLTAGATYHYQVRAVDAAATAGPWSEQVSATVPGGLDAPTGLTAQASEGAVELSWDAVTGASRYELWSWSSETGWQRLDDGGLTGTTHTHDGLTAGATYYYQVRAVDAAGTTGPWSTRVSATVPGGLDAPQGFTAQASEGAVELSWDAVTGAARYELWGWWSRETGWQRLDDGGLTGTSYSHSGLAAGTTYYYQSRSVNAAGEPSPWSQQVSATPMEAEQPASTQTSTPTPTTSTPAAPVLTVQAGAANTIELSWTAVAGAVRYKLWVWWTIETGWQRLDDGGLTGTSYIHRGLAAGTTYFYSVGAVNAAGETGPPSEYASATASDSPLAMTTTTTPTPTATVPAMLPDLVVDTITTSDDSPMAGQSLSLNATVRNRGTGASSPSTLRYYRSADSTITSGDMELGTAAVSGLGASESSAASILTDGPSQAGTYYYGACVDSVSDESDTTNNCSTVVSVVFSEFRVENLPWVADGISGREQRAIDHIRALARIDAAMSQRMANSPWLSDGVSEDELQILDDLLSLARTHPEIAALVTTISDQNGFLIEAVLVSLRYLPAGWPEQLLSQSWFQDGLTEEEAALIVVLQDTARSDEDFKALINGGHVLSETTSLPLAGEVDLYAVGRSKRELDVALERMRFAAASMETFMEVPWPKADVIVLIALESDLGVPHSGWNSGTHITMKNTSKNLIYHELAHHYFSTGPLWLNEGAADFLMFHILRLTGDADSIDQRYFSDSHEIGASCGRHGAATVQRWIDTMAGASNCPYLLGRQFLGGLYRTLGHEVVTSALRQLYETGLASGRYVTEDEIYQAFLTNTPPSRRDEYHQWYHCLHGRSVPGYTPAPMAASPEIREVLVALYNATNGPGWKNRENWLSDAPLDQWYGVSSHCDGSLSLDLSSNDLTGSIPSQLGQLSNLQALDLSFNDLTGSIPSQLGQLSNLQALDLSFNDLTGSIPSQLGQLSNLQVLGLHYNQLTGSIPSQLGQLSNLQVLGLHVNQLTGSIPSQLGQLSRLDTLRLEGNQLTGSIPIQLGQLSRLDTLRLEYNLLTGSIPSQLGQLSNLQVLYLHYNQLTGRIPMELDNLVPPKGSLKSVRIATRNTSLCGPIPPALHAFIAPDSGNEFFEYTNDLSSDTYPSGNLGSCSSSS